MDHEHVQSKAVYQDKRQHRVHADQQTSETGRRRKLICGESRQKISTTRNGKPFSIALPRPHAWQLHICCRYRYLYAAQPLTAVCSTNCLGALWLVLPHHLHATAYTQTQFFAICLRTRFFRLSAKISVTH